MTRILAYHALVAARLSAESVQQARERLERWVQDGRMPQDAAVFWRHILSRPLDEIRSKLFSADETLTHLLQSTPLIGVLSNRERWDLVRRHAA